MLGSFTRLYRLSENVLRAIWLLAHPLIGIRATRLVVGSSTVTTRLIPASRKSSLIASLYFCQEMRGDNCPSPSLKRTETLAFASSIRDSLQSIDFRSQEIPELSKVCKCCLSLRCNDFTDRYPHSLPFLIEDLRRKSQQSHFPVYKS